MTCLSPLSSPKRAFDEPPSACEGPPKKAKELSSPSRQQSYHSQVQTLLNDLGRLMEAHEAEMARREQALRADLEACLLRWRESRMKKKAEFTAGVKELLNELGEVTEDNVQCEMFLKEAVSKVNDLCRVFNQ